MYRFLIVILFLPCVLKAQQSISFQSADSVSYQLYLQGDWEELINYGKKVIKQDIDFKNLRKRIGYAYFVKNDFYSAQNQYEKALHFDKSDMDVILYLYYCGLNAGDAATANYYASKLPVDLQKSVGIKSTKLLQNADIEFNYKINDDSLDIRSNPTYYRFGIQSKLNYRFNLYQAFSQYAQSVNQTTATLQTEYYVSLNMVFNAHSTFDVAYHYVGTLIDTNLFPSNMYFAKFTKNNGQLSYGMNGSILSNAMGNFGQFGLFGSYNIDSKKSVYLNSALNCLTDSSSLRFIFSQSAGIHLFKPLWVEGNITIGNLKNYNDNNALYVYNSLDATIFRSGISLFYTLGKKITVFTNYTYDLKQLDDPFLNIKYNYNQHSISGGLIWKL